MNDICPTCGGTGKVIDALKLRNSRISRKLRLVDVAKKMGIGPSYLSDLENGRRDWNTDLLSAFNKAIGK